MLIISFDCTRMNENGRNLSTETIHWTSKDWIYCVWQLQMIFYVLGKWILKDITWTKKICGNLLHSGDGVGKRETPKNTTLIGKWLRRFLHEHNLFNTLIIASYDAWILQFYTMYLLTWHGRGYEILVGHSYFILGLPVWFFSLISFHSFNLWSNNYTIE